MIIHLPKPDPRRYKTKMKLISRKQFNKHLANEKFADGPWVPPAGYRYDPKIPGGEMAYGQLTTGQAVYCYTNAVYEALAMETAVPLPEEFAKAGELVNPTWNQPVSGVSETSSSTLAVKVLVIT